MNVCPRAGRSIGLYLRHTRSVRPYSASTSTEATLETAADLVPDPLHSNDCSTTRKRKCRITTSVVLSRPPVLTQELTEFEESYYFYQRRLNQRLALPFTRYFYFKKGTPADDEWKRKQKAVGDIYSGFGPRAWADELLVGDSLQKEEDFGYKRLVETTVSGEDAAEAGSGGEGSGKAALQKPISRTTQADIENDRKNLNRKLAGTLYLLVKPKEKNKWRREEGWVFPESGTLRRETLRDAAERALTEAAGVNMNTWFVGNVPIGHFVPAPHRRRLPPREKVFFMKARIMAGQADLAENTLGYEDFLWLTKEEIQELTDPHYWVHIRSMLVSQ